jgi:DNA-binding HxlR family transcriptional regulator
MLRQFRVGGNPEQIMGKIQSIRARALQSRDAIELLSNKWRITILHLLTPGPLRANALQRAIPQVSSKMLTQTLRGMERDGLIQRDVQTVVPPHVEYQLTTMGESIIPLLRNLCLWAKANATTRDEARIRFDQARPTSRKQASTRLSTRTD